MSLPSDAFGLIALIALVFPGLTFTAVRASLQGHNDIDHGASTKALQAIVIGTCLDALYLLVAPGLVVPIVMGKAALLSSEPGIVAITFLVAAVIVPAVLAIAIYGRFGKRGSIHEAAGRARRRLFLTQHDSTPTAWDHALHEVRGGWIRIRLSETGWVGGRWSDDCFLSTYPRPRDIFIKEHWVMGPDGSFICKAPYARGLWIRVNDDNQVEWIKADESGTPE